jgi:Na+-transporting NADH:ubiquinone oxidoreductase subunit NqrC
LDETIAQLEEDMDEDSDKLDREKQMLKISELKSQKAVVNAEKGTVAEVNALRNRIAFLEEMNRIYEQRADTTYLDMANELSSTEM